MLAPLRGDRADYSLMLEKYGNMNFYPCQAKSGQASTNGTWEGSWAQFSARLAWVQTPKNSSAAAATATSPTTGRGDLVLFSVMERPPISSAPAEVLL